MNSFGTVFKVTIFGESHGPAVGVVVDGIAPGIALDTQAIAFEMGKRRAAGAISTARQEQDEVEFLSGVYNGRTTGTSLCIAIKNADTRSKDYASTLHMPRPGHADYTGMMKYHQYNDPRGGGHFSGRLTAPLVAVGAICRKVLQSHGVVLGTHLSRCAGINDQPLPTGEKELEQALLALNQKQFAVLNEKAGEAMQQAILQAKAEKDSVGGILETAITGLEPGLGEPFFDSLESVLAHLYFAIPGVKGVEFGLGFGFADLRGSQGNDGFVFQDGRIQTRTNHNGGINGGISNGMPVLVRTVVKPTASIARPQATLDLEQQKEGLLELKGRHDPCIVHRARAVADAVTAIGLVDLFSQRYGVLWQNKELETK